MILGQNANMVACCKTLFVFKSWSRSTRQNVTSRRRARRAPNAALTCQEDPDEVNCSLVIARLAQGTHVLRQGLRDVKLVNVIMHICAFLGRASTSEGCRYTHSEILTTRGTHRVRSRGVLVASMYVYVLRYVLRSLGRASMSRGSRSTRIRYFLFSFTILW